MMLAKSGNEVIVVDKDEKKVKEMRQYTDCAFVTDDLSADTLKEIGIQYCDVVFICNGENVDVSVLTSRISRAGYGTPTREKAIVQ